MGFLNFSSHRSSSSIPTEDEEPDGGANIDAVRDYDDITSDEESTLLRLGHFLVPSVEGVSYGISEEGFLVVMYGDDTMTVIARASSRSALPWEDTVTTLSSQKDAIIDDNGVLGRQVSIPSTREGRVLIKGFDGYAWYVMAFMMEKADTSAFDTVLTHLVIDRGEEPLAPNTLLPAKTKNIRKDRNEEYSIDVTQELTQEVQRRLVSLRL